MTDEIKNPMESQSEEKPEESQDEQQGAEEKPEDDFSDLYTDGSGAGSGDDDEMQDIPNFYVPDSDAVFPAGLYVLALGGIRPVRSKDDSSKVIAVLNDLWVVKYYGTEDSPADQTRVAIRDGNPELSERGAKMVERYPNPSEQPSMAWKSRAFFSHFDTLDETPTGEKYVNWAKVSAQKGRVFRVHVQYNKGKDKTGNTKNYRNLVYDSLEVDTRKISPSDMQKIESKYQEMMKERNEKEKEQGPKTDVDDLPF